jgi:hypothetical protein
MAENENDLIKQQFDVLRKKARQAATSQTQQEKEGLQRRFAQLGRVGSGTQIRLESQAAERGAKRLGEAEESVGLAELGERRRVKELGEAREFAVGEREASQRFGAEQAGLGRQFASGEALKGREFGAEQAGIGRQFASGEALKGREFGAEQAGLGRTFAAAEASKGRSFAGQEAAKGRDLQTSQFGKSIALQEKALNTQAAQADRQFEEDVTVRKFNSIIAQMTGELIDPEVALAQIEALTGGGATPGLGGSQGPAAIRQRIQDERTRQAQAGGAEGLSGFASLGIDFGGFDMGNIGGFR